MDEKEYWRGLYERTVQERNKALFTIGWLKGELENCVGREKAAQKVNNAKAEAERYYKTVDLQGENTWEASAPME